MISNDINSTATVRNVFIIDSEGTVRTILIYPIEIGRFIPEIIRIIQALQTSDNCKSYAPANWTEGEPMIVPPPKTYAGLEQRIKSIEENKNGMNWYLSFKNCE